MSPPIESGVLVLAEPDRQLVAALPSREAAEAFIKSYHRSDSPEKFGAQALSIWQIKHDQKTLTCLATVRPG